MEGGVAILAAVRTILAILMLGYASYKDVKSREVSDLVWILFGAVGVAVDAYEVHVGALGVMPLLAAVGFMVVFALLSGYLGLFGGADLLAFITIGLLCPTTPALGFQPILFEPFFFTLTVISNSVMIGASGALFVLVYNLVNHRGHTFFEGYVEAGPLVRLVLLLTGIKKSLDSVRGPPYEYPLEKVDEEGSVSLILRPDLGDDAGAEKTLERLRSLGKKKVWVSYSLPFLLILSFGYLSAITLGDFALWLVTHFIH